MPDPPITNRELLAIANAALQKILTGAVREYRIGSITYARYNIDELLNLIKYLQRAVADEDAAKSGGPFQHSQAVFGGWRHR